MSHHQPHPMFAEDGARVKPEPDEDDRMEDVHNDSQNSHENHSTFADDSTAPPPSQRALIDGKPYPSRCFEGQVLLHPHHHRLVCGHTIVTDTIQGCGRNCSPSKTAEEKCRGTPFACPVPECYHKIVKGNPFAPKKHNGKKTEQHRLCTLSHVYGDNQEADEARLQEKQEWTALDERSRRAKIRDESWRYRKRSKSPTAGPAPNQTRARPKAPSPDPAEVLNQQLAGMNPKAREALLNASGPGVRKKKDGRFVTRADENAERMQGIFMNNDAEKRKQEERQREEDARREAMGEAERAEQKEKDKRTIMPLPECECKSCKLVFPGLRMHCFDCDDFDLCTRCLDEGRSGHDRSHRIFAVRRRDDWVNDSMLADHPPVEMLCICSEISPRHMVLCETCNGAYHPGCVGQGRWTQEAYAEDFGKQKESWEKDWEQWTKNLGRHNCPSCQTKAVDMTASGEEVIGQTDRSKRQAERSIKNHLNWLRRQIKELDQYFLPGQKEEKDAEISRAEGLEEEKDVEDRWYTKLKRQRDEEEEANVDLGIGSFKAKPFTQATKRTFDSIDDSDDDVRENDASSSRQTKRPKGVRDQAARAQDKKGPSGMSSLSDLVKSRVNPKAKSTPNFTAFAMSAPEPKDPKVISAMREVTFKGSRALAHRPKPSKLSHGRRLSG